MTELKTYGSANVSASQICRCLRNFREKKTETKTKTEKSMSSHYITFNITPIYVIKPELH